METAKTANAATSFALENYGAIMLSNNFCESSNAPITIAKFSITMRGCDKLCFFYEDR